MLRLQKKNLIMQKFFHEAAKVTFCSLESHCTENTNCIRLTSQEINKSIEQLTQLLSFYKFQSLILHAVIENISFWCLETVSPNFLLGCNFAITKISWVFSKSPWNFAKWITWWIGDNAKISTGLDFWQFVN